MNLFFADISVEGGAVAIGAVFVAIAAMAHGANEILKLMDRTKDNPPVGDQVRKVIEWAEKKFATKDEVNLSLGSITETIEGHERVATEFRSGLKKDVHDLTEKLSERSGKIFDAIRSLGREISHMEGRLAKTQKLTITKEGA